MAHTLEVRAVSLRFGGVRALTEVSFGVNDGELFSIIGPNGAGQPVQRSRDEVVLQEVMPPDYDVVEHAHMMKQRQILERSADSERWPRIRIEARNVLAAIEQLAFGRLVSARNAIDD